MAQLKKRNNEIKEDTSLVHQEQGKRIDDERRKTSNIQARKQVYVVEQIQWSSFVSQLSINEDENRMKL